MSTLLRFTTCPREKHIASTLNNFNVHKKIGPPIKKSASITEIVFCIESVSCLRLVPSKLTHARETLGPPPSVYQFYTELGISTPSATQQGLLQPVEFKCMYPYDSDHFYMYVSTQNEFMGTRCMHTNGQTYGDSMHFKEPILWGLDV